MLSQVDWRRVATGGGVLLFHLLLLLLLLSVTGVVPLNTVGTPHEIVITLSNLKRAQPNTPLPNVPNQVPLPNETQPLTIPHTLTLPPAAPQKEQTPQGDIHALGRYLFNCSGAYYEELSAKEKEHCLHNRWNGEKNEQAPLLGPPKPSPFDEVIKERNTPAAPIEKPCPPDSPQSNLGIPCYDFSGHHLLEEVPGH